jgi:flagellar basal body-associated protein FliL
LSTSLFAETFEVSAFESDLFSKQDSGLHKVTLSLWMEGESLKKHEHQITDALNIMISSFYVEDLLTSQGKEKFKQALQHYLQEKYALKVQAVYLKKLTQNNPSLDKAGLLDILKDAGYSKKETNVKELFNDVKE